MKLNASSKLRALPIGAALSSIALAGSLQAAVTFTVSDVGPAVNTSTPPTTNLVGASVSSGIAAANITPQITYTLTNVDLSSLGGTTLEEIVFTVTFSVTSGSVAYNALATPNGNVFNGAGSLANQIESGEDLTATVALSSTTFAPELGSVAIGFTTAVIGGNGTGESWNIVHDSGTTAGVHPTNGYVIPSSSFWTIQDVATTAGTAGINLQGYTVTLNASPVPEPSAALFGGLGLLAMLRRRR